jgi:hypothetical protein
MWPCFRQVTRHRVSVRTEGKPLLEQYGGLHSAHTAQVPWSGLGELSGEICGGQSRKAAQSKQNIGGCGLELSRTFQIVTKT